MLKEEPVEDRLIKRYIEKSEKKKLEIEETQKPKSPFMSKRSKKLAEKSKMKKNLIHEFDKEEDVPNLYEIEYREDYEFLVDALKHK